MIPFEVTGLTGAGDGPAARLADALRALARRLRASGRGPDDVLALTVFADLAGPREWEEAAAAVRRALPAAFDGDPPPATLVAQAPADGAALALEAVVLSPAARGATVRRRRGPEAAWTVVTAGPVRQVHGGGIAVPDGGADPVGASRRALAAMEAALAAEGLDFGHVVRQWNYLECVLDVREASGRRCQCYQAFNDARALYYDRAAFPAGYPASTGIGQAAGGVAIEFIALDAPPPVEVRALTNPGQVDAHRYSDEVLVGEASAGNGRAPPKFERAKRVVSGDDEVVFVSGTAAVVGERSTDPGDVRGQTRRSIGHFLALTGGRPPSHLRAYVKRREDAAAVREVCGGAFGAPPALCLIADVCRDELLVEIEGVVLGRAPGANGGAG